MADAIGQNVADVINEPGIVQAVGNVITKIGELQTSIAETNSKHIDVQVNLIGAESLTEINAGLVRVQQTINSYAATQQQASQITADSAKINNIYGDSISELAKELAFMRNDYDATKEKIKQLNEQYATGTIGVKNYTKQLTEVTEANVRLKQSINETTAAITSQTDIGIAKQQEALEKQLKTIQAREIKQIESAERAANAEQAASIKRANSFEAAAIREQIAAIKTGNVLASQAERERIAAERSTISYQILQKAKNMAFRFPALIVEIAILTALFEAISYVSKAVQEAIPGTDAYIAKQEKMTQANDALKTSFQQLGDEIEKLIELQNNAMAGIAGMDNIYHSDAVKTLEDMKLLEASVKRKGELDKDGNNAAEQQHAAAENRRKVEIDGITKKIALYQTLFDVTEKNLSGASSGKENSGSVVEDYAANLKNVALPLGFLDKIKADIDKNIKDGGSLLSALMDARLQYAAKIKELTDQKKTVGQQTLDELNAQHNAAYDKRLELEKSLLTAHEEFRQLAEAGDAASVDKVVNDVREKYRLMYIDIEKQRKVFVENYTGDKNDPEYLKAIAGYDSLLGTKKNSERAESSEKGRIELLREIEANLQQYGSELGGNAGILQNKADNGMPDYDAMAKANDAKRIAEKWQESQNLISLTKTEGADIAEAERQSQERQKEIDQKYYKERLGLATDYFQKIADKVTEATDSFATDTDTQTYNAMTAIIRGPGSQDRKDAKIDRLQKRQDAKKLQERNDAIRDKLLPEAQLAVDKTSAVGSIGGGDAENAQKKAMDAVGNLRNEQAKNKLQIAKDLSPDEKLKEAWSDFYKSLPNYANQAMQAIQQLQQNQFAVEQQNLEIKQREVALQSEQQIAAINATAGYQITKDQEVAKVVAQTTAQQNSIQQQQNQLALKQARAQKQAAEANIVATTAEAIMKTFAAYADIPGGVAISLAESAVIGAIGAVQFAAVASVPLPQFAGGTPEGGTTARLFIAGEAGPEIIDAPGKTPYITDGAKIHNEPIGTHVIPMSRMLEYAAANVTGQMRYDPQMQQSYNNEMIMKELAKIIGDKYEDGSSNIVSAIYGTAKPTPDSGKAYAKAVRQQSRLNSTLK